MEHDSYLFGQVVAYFFFIIVIAAIAYYIYDLINSDND